MDIEGPIAADPSYSLDDAIKNGVAAEAAYAHLDLGPVDTLDPAILEAEYNLFFGASPLSSLSSSPMPSRSASPATRAPDIESQRDTPCGASSLSSPTFSRTALPVSEEPCPGLSPPADAYHEPLRHGKAAKRREKSHANRRRKRQEVHAQQDKNALPYPNSHKHIARAESVATSYDTNTIPSASSGFVALPDRGDRGSKVHETRELLDGESFKLIQWNGTYVYVPFSSAADSNSRVPRVVRAIVDKDGRVIAVLAGCPNDSNWESVHKSGHVALQSARKRCRFPKKARNHRRGNFPALSAGISFGGGQKVCLIYPRASRA